MSRFSRAAVMLSTLSLLSPASLAAGGEDLLVVDRDTTLDPHKTYGRIEIRASRITLDGRGARLVGAKQGPANKFHRVAVSAQGTTDVTIKNIRAQGWEIGVRLTDCDRWTIEDCDFSDNFHDPAFGWGENGRRGGMLLERVRQTTVRRCRASRVWDGCVLVDSDDNVLEKNDFSRTSNTCLKLWHASRNRIRDNNLSYGIRQEPNEVHARDSTCVLLESGSNDNYFSRNDCTHGGDGIFIRVLNGWVSTGNVFEENDCSHANNNCVEAWSPRNKYVRNKANHGSYGFWLGASDQTVLWENEASYNGLPDGNHNSPHLPGGTHAGIVFMFGPSSHTIVRGNRCVGNNGAGIALIGDQPSQGAKWKAYHWIIEGNELRDNRWGIYAQYADWIDLAANRTEKNVLSDVHAAEGVTRLVRHAERPEITAPPTAVLSGPARAVVAEQAAFDASASRDPQGRPLRFAWDLGDGATSDQARVEHVYQKPGFYRLGLTVNNGLFSDLAWRDVYVTETLPELAAEGTADQWEVFDEPGVSRAVFRDDREAISGATSVAALIRPYSGTRVNLLYPRARRGGWSLSGKTHLVFWLKTINENLPAWQDVNPVVTLHGDEGRSVRYQPRRDLLSQPPYNEAREGWTYFSIPLCGDELWRRDGETPARLEYLTIGFDSWGAPPLLIWLDGLALK